MDTREVRQKYLDWQQQHGHTIIPRSLLVPQDDPTTLFTGSGMQPLIQYLLGEQHPAGQRVANSQTCLRVEDIDEVGDNRHTTFFEMLGNWSLGDYFKQEQLEWFFTFLVDEIKLDPTKIYVTCFIGDPASQIPKDEESAQKWQELFASKGISHNLADIGSEQDGYQRGMKDDERIFYYDATKNWWSRAGVPSNMPAGEPGGPDSEVFYDFELEHDKSYGEHCHPNCDCGRFLEIGNSVFMEYVKAKNGFEPLPNKNVDFGGGLERISAALNNDADVFKIPLIWPIIIKLEEISGKQYQENLKPMRIIADHLRAAVWLAVDGVLPSNKEQGYVMRRLIRRAVLNAHELGITNQLAEQITPVIIEAYKLDFPEVSEKSQNLVDILVREEKLFRQTLKKGLKIFEKEVIIQPDNINLGVSLPAASIQLTGKMIFLLHDTYGFPYELSREEAEKREITVDKNWKQDFDKLMQEQRQRSRTATKGQFKGGLGGQTEMHKKLHTATHLLYVALKQVLGDHVVQKGANITDERLRFDFAHDQKVTPEEVIKIEAIVNEQIEKDLPVTWKEENTKEALNNGAAGAFGDKYGDIVKVYTVGDPSNPFSREICGGPHVDHTGQLSDDGKHFKITKEEASSAGVRRIKAVLQ